MFKVKLLGWLIVGVAAMVGGNVYLSTNQPQRVASAYRQLEDDDAAAAQFSNEQYFRNEMISGSVVAWVVIGLLLLGGDAMRFIKKSVGLLSITIMALSATGCGVFVKPFEPVVYEEIDTSEEGFLIPLTGDKSQQASTSSEADLAANLVNVKRVQVPQAWKPLGYQWPAYNGTWIPAAKLVKVDRAPVTREWTADPNSGTSNKNEAIWVMSADQVEFSTGWTCTARIKDKESAVKFLHNYPSGSLKDVLDREVRAKLQAEFGIEVTDLPMDELRKAATPHIQNVAKSVTAFFEERGIEITNLGITGGFVYKDPTIVTKLVEVFNAEQEKAIRAAEFAAQDMKNKTVLAEADGKAKALLTTKEAEAKGIQAVADAKAYEIEKAKQDLATYLELKRLEIDKAKWERWDGKFPTTLFGSNAANMLMTLPTPLEEKK